MGGVLFGRRRAVILKSHGFDLLQEKGEQRDPGEVGAVLVSPGLDSCCFSTLDPPSNASFLCSFSKYPCLL